MHKAIWKGAVIAQSDDVVTVEGNLYFPRASVRSEFLRPSSTVTHCAWKGSCSYLDLVVDGEVNHDAAWYYPAPTEAARAVADRVAFWKGVKTE